MLVHKHRKSNYLILTLLGGILIVLGDVQTTILASEPETLQRGAIVSDNTPNSAAEQRSDFAKLLSLISQTESDSDTLWEAVKNDPFVLSSGSADPSFHFETSSAKPRSKERLKGAYIRLLMECQGSNNMMLKFYGSTFSPMLYLSNTHQIEMTGNKAYDLSQVERWGYVFDQNHLHDFADLKFGSKNLSGFSHFDCSSLLNGLMKEVVPASHWEPITRTLILIKENGVEVQLRFRTPSDAIRYGTSLSEVRTEDVDGHRMCFRSFQTVPSSRTRLPCLNIKDVEKKLKDKTNNGLAIKLMIDRLWDATTSFHYIPKRVGSKKKSTWTELSLPDRIFVINTFFVDLGPSKTNERVSPLPSEEVEKIHFYALIDHFQEMWLWVANDNLNEGVYPDDPSMLWREIEASFGPTASMILIIHGLDYVFKNESSSPELKIRFLDALGDWGFPPFLDNEKAWELKKRFKEFPLYEAILWSRWQWPCEQKHIDACVKASKESALNSAKERVATETLIRLDAIPRLLKNVMERWYQSQIAQVGPAERRINLSLLSLQPTGRDYLLNRLKTKVDTIGIQTDVAKILQARVQATLKTKRFDFITQDKCDEILAVTEPILSSSN